MPNPYLSGGDAKPRRKRSIEHERRVAARMSPGTHARAGSGCRPFGRGDLIGPGVLGEHKFIYGETRAFVMHRASLAKIVREARTELRKPLFVVTFEGLERAGVDPDWVFTPVGVVPEGVPSVTARRGAASVTVSREFVSKANPEVGFVVVFDAVPGVPVLWHALPMRTWRNASGLPPESGYTPPSTVSQKPTMSRKLKA